jgi:hypothetical protein
MYQQIPTKKLRQPFVGSRRKATKRTEPSAKHVDGSEARIRPSTVCHILNRARYTRNSLSKQEESLRTVRKYWQAKQAGNTNLTTSRSSIKAYLGTTAKPQLDDLFAEAIYTSTASFSTFETPEWTTFFKALHYKPPDRK